MQTTTLRLPPHQSGPAEEPKKAVEGIALINQDSTCARSSAVIVPALFDRSISPTVYFVPSRT